MTHRISNLDILVAVGAPRPVRPQQAQLRKSRVAIRLPKKGLCRGICGDSPSILQNFFPGNQVGHVMHGLAILVNSSARDQTIKESVVACKARRVEVLYVRVRSVSAWYSNSSVLVMRKYSRRMGWTG